MWIWGRGAALEIRGGFWREGPNLDKMEEPKGPSDEQRDADQETDHLCGLGSHHFRPPFSTINRSADAIEVRIFFRSWRKESVHYALPPIKHHHSDRYYAHKVLDHSKDVSRSRWMNEMNLSLEDAGIVGFVAGIAGKKALSDDEKSDEEGAGDEHQDKIEVVIVVRGVGNGLFLQRNER